jgi:hypothetical protein
MQKRIVAAIAVAKVHPWTMLTRRRKPARHVTLSERGVRVKMAVRPVVSVIALTCGA